jgi:antitoxin HicB
MDKTVEYYMGLPYTIELVPEPCGGWFVAVKELPGCMSEGDTPGEAVEMIRDAMRGWIEVSLEDDDPIPEPRSLEDYSGKFVVRVPRSLHQDLVDIAQQENVSLNQYINVALARSVGQPVAISPATIDEPAWPGLRIRKGLVQE